MGIYSYVIASEFVQLHSKLYFTTGQYDNEPLQSQMLDTSLGCQQGEMPRSLLTVEELDTISTITSEIRTLGTKQRQDGHQ
jgi:hypothetical protein